jgi:hypothetical protein
MLTPFFPIPWGELSTDSGVQSPLQRQIAARDLVGRIVGNGRYVIRRKTGHSQESVSYAVHDMMAGIEIQLELHPDEQQRQGFRLGRSDALQSKRDLPNLYNEEATRESSQIEIKPESWWMRTWRSFKRLFR